MKITCYIDATSNLIYGSFYILGLYQLYGKNNVKFNYSKFKNLPDPGWNLRFIVKNNHSSKRYFIHTNDTYVINEEMYDWCDVYGHVNANFSKYSIEKYPKVISLVPSFGIDVFGEQSVYIAIKTFLKGWRSIVNRNEWNNNKQKLEQDIIINIKNHLARIYRLHKNRLRYEQYQTPSISINNYVFFMSTLWYSNIYNKNDEGVNLRRAKFIRNVKSNFQLNFEGGLLVNKSSTKGIFDDVITTKRISIENWINKTKQSMFVFNTPAFWDCHGWKLGEYLALGKCIISTPLSNDLPAPLIHGQNIHFVKNDKELEDAVKYITLTPEYKEKLEKGAKEYWEKYGTPIKSLELLGLKAE